MDCVDMARDAAREQYGEANETSFSKVVAIAHGFLRGRA